MLGGRDCALSGFAGAVVCTSSRTCVCVRLFVCLNLCVGVWVCVWVYVCLCALGLTPQNLTSVGLQFVLARTQLTDLSGLSSLTSVGGGLSVTANPRLTSLHGLSGVTQVCECPCVRV